MAPAGLKSLPLNLNICTGKKIVKRTGKHKRVPFFVSGAFEHGKTAAAIGGGKKTEQKEQTDSPQTLVHFLSRFVCVFVCYGQNNHQAIIVAAVVVVEVLIEKVDDGNTETKHAFSTLFRPGQTKTNFHLFPSPQFSPIPVPIER